MKKKIDYFAKLSIIYYINNSPLLTLQNVQQELELRYKCKVGYFDFNFFFLQVDWPYTVFKNNSISVFKNKLILTDADSKQSFLIPVAVILNGGIISFPYFVNLFTNKDFDLLEEIVKNYTNSVSLNLSNVDILSFSATKEILSFTQINSKF